MDCALAGAALKGEDVLLLQSELILKVANVNDGEIARTLAFTSKPVSWSGRRRTRRR